MLPGTTVSDQFPKNRIKGIITVGVVAKVKINWETAVIRKLG